jgi:Na+/melibiose symporter-like transporter
MDNGTVIGIIIGIVGIIATLFCAKTIHKHIIKNKNKIKGNNNVVNSITNIREDKD